MNILNTTFNGGEPIYLDDIRWNDTAYRNAMNGILQAFGNNFIVQGCTPSTPSFMPGTTTITSGYIMLNGQLLQVDANAIPSNNYYSLVITYNSSGQDTYYTGTTHNVYQQNRGVANSGSGSLNIYGPRLNGIILTTSNIGSNSGQTPSNGSNLNIKQLIGTNGSGNLISIKTGSTANSIPKVGTANLGNNLPLFTDGSGNLKTNSINSTLSALGITSGNFFNFSDLTNVDNTLAPGATGNYITVGGGVTTIVTIALVNIRPTGTPIGSGYEKNEYVIGAIPVAYVPFLFDGYFPATYTASNMPTPIGIYSPTYFHVDTAGNLLVSLPGVPAGYSVNGVCTYIAGV